MFYHYEVFDDKVRFGICLSRRTGRWKCLKVMGDVHHLTAVWGEMGYNTAIA